MSGGRIWESTLACLSIASRFDRRISIRNPNQEVICVPTNRSPTPLPDRVYHLGGLRSTLSEVSADQHFINWLRTLKMGNYLGQCYQIAMWIRKESDPPR